MMMMGRLASRFRRVQARVASSLHRSPADARIVFVEPCYWVVDRLSSDSVIADMGLGNDADFSMAMINRYGLTAHGFDPTRRHVPALRNLAEQSHGRFVFHDKAIGAEPGIVTFHESQENISGSTMNRHHNVLHDTIQDYEVEVITLGEALHLAGPRVDLVKMDIEGSEEGVLDSTSDDLLRSVDQWCIEFHHDTVAGTTFSDTRRYLARFAELGFRMYSRNNTDFLLYRPAGRLD